jgi:hypothetical protein
VTWALLAYVKSLFRLAMLSIQYYVGIFFQEKTKKMLLEYDIQLEDFGGDIQAVPISALKVVFLIVSFTLFYNSYWTVKWLVLLSYWLHCLDFSLHEVVKLYIYFRRTANINVNCFISFNLMLRMTNGTCYYFFLYC